LLAWSGSGLLPSTGITQLHRYCKPIRHPHPPTLALAGSSLVASSPPPRLRTSLVAHLSFPARAAVTTPVESPAAYLARFTGDFSLPRYCGGSASTSAFSGPARRSLALQPARTADPLKRPFLGVLQVIRYLLTRSECFRLERELAGPDFHRGEWCTLSRHTQQRCRTQPPIIVVGRNNWLFYGSDKGGRTGAVLNTLIATCKRLRVDPFAYLRDLFARIAAHPQARLDELLPDRWQLARSAAQS
jgi:hypothetical protein